MNKALYKIEKECPVCHKQFLITRVRTRIVMLKQDTDFCTYYQAINPYWYTVWVCEHCSYSAQDIYFEELTLPQAEKLRKVLTDNPIKLSVSGERTCVQAIATYRLALACAEAANLPASRLGGLYLRLGWVYRMTEMADEEKAAHVKAIQYYIEAYQREEFPIGKMSDITLAYLIGELLRRNGQYDQAILYLNEVIRNPRSKGEKRILPMARDAYQQCRAAKVQAQEKS